MLDGNLLLEKWICEQSGQIFEPGARRFWWNRLVACWVVAAIWHQMETSTCDACLHECPSWNLIGEDWCLQTCKVAACGSHEGVAICVHSSNHQACKLIARPTPKVQKHCPQTRLNLRPHTSWLNKAVACTIKGCGYWLHGGYPWSHVIAWFIVILNLISGWLLFTRWSWPTWPPMQLQKMQALVIRLTTQLW